MIKSFNCEATKKLFEQGKSRKLPQNILRVALRKLTMLESASKLKDLKVPPGNRLEALQGDRKGHYSIRINSQWRLCFEWHEDNAYQVEIVDYHH